MAKVDVRLYGTWDDKMNDGILEFLPPDVEGYAGIVHNKERANKDRLIESSEWYVRDGAEGSIIEFKYEDGIKTSFRYQFADAYKSVRFFEENGDLQSVLIKLK
jgi:hypothetical protein